jgi:sigma-B regulation protein RsbU (phosphoserine phosphatase)
MAGENSRKQGSYFTPMQVGSIASRVGPIDVASDAKWTVDLNSGRPEAGFIPVGRHGVILGIIRWENVDELKGSFLSRILGKNNMSFLMPVVEVIEASSSIHTVVERGLKQTRWDDPAWYVVEHGKKYFGIVSLRQMLEYLDGIQARDIARAGEIQKNLLAQPAISDPRFTLLSYNRMANEVGGDWFKTLQLSKDLYLIGCFDVAGKNISGSLVTMSLGSCFAMLELINYGSSPEELSSIINGLIRKVNPPDVFVAATILYIDFSRMSVVVHNFGLSPVAAFIPQDKKIAYKTLVPNLPPLGMDSAVNPDPPQKLAIENGLRVTVHSDGLMDMCDIYGERYGDTRTLKFLQNLHYVSVENFSSFVDKELDLWTKDTALADDVTMFEVRFKVEEAHV